MRRAASPNPGVGCVIVTADGGVFEGATRPPGEAHAEIVALDAARAAGAEVRGAAVFVTLEPCAHTGRTPPCTDALIASGVGRVVVALEDPDANVAGAGVAALHAAGIEVDIGVGVDEVVGDLVFYVTHRRLGRPYVTLKLATTLDGRTAAPDGTSRWITGPEARADAHRLRAQHDAVLVGAGTVRLDNPRLTVRDAEGPDPVRVVLGTAAPDAAIRPCLERTGPLYDVLRGLAVDGITSVLVEGGATVAHAFHADGLVDRYVIYLAPALLGGDDGAPLFMGAGAPTIAEAWRGDIVDVAQIGNDVRVTVVPSART